MIIQGIVLALTNFTIFGSTTTIIQVRIAAGFIGFGYRCINPTANTFIVKVYPIERRRAATAI